MANDNENANYVEAIIISPFWPMRRCYRTFTLYVCCSDLDIIYMTERGLLKKHPSVAEKDLVNLPSTRRLKALTQLRTGCSSE